VLKTCLSERLAQVLSYCFPFGGHPWGFILVIAWCMWDRGTRYTWVLFGAQKALDTSFGKRKVCIPQSD
jgi:hypothetical protein